MRDWKTVGLRRLWILCSIPILAASCSLVKVDPASTIAERFDAAFPTDVWAASSPEVLGMDSERLAFMLERIAEQNYRIDSLSVIRKGHLVLDVPIHPYEEGRKHVIRSCTKSIVSLLIGIAIDEGFIEGVDTPVLAFFPDRAFTRLDADKEAMRLEDLLTMSSGLRCRDSYLYSWHGLYRLWESEDWVQFMLDLPMEAAPGEKFEYCNGGSHLLSAILTETTGMSALEFADAHLFGPLGITDVAWETNAAGVSIGYSDLEMLPKDLAKIGYLTLMEGQWAGEQIVSASWVRASTWEHMAGTLADGYGYQWWVDDDGFFMALGYGGQYIVVHPELDLVVVFTSELPENKFYVPKMLLEDFIFPAVVSDEALPEDPGSVMKLQEWIEVLSTP